MIEKAFGKIKTKFKKDLKEKVEYAVNEKDTKIIGFYKEFEEIYKIEKEMNLVCDGCGKNDGYNVIEKFPNKCKKCNKEGFKCVDLETIQEKLQEYEHKRRMYIEKRLHEEEYELNLK